MSYSLIRSATIASLAAIFLSGCGTLTDRLDAAARKQAEAGVVDAALASIEAERELGRVLPDMPAECRRVVTSGVRAGDRLDVAVLKLDRALTTANGRVVNCSAWYADLRARLQTAGAAQ